MKLHRKLLNELLKYHRKSLPSAAIYFSTFLCFLLLASCFLMVGCGERTPTPTVPPTHIPVAEVFVPPPREAIVRYHYRGEKYPDPFVQLSERPSFPEEIVVPDINSMVLKGIFVAGGDKISLITSGGLSYYVRGTKLYDARWRLIPGFFCTQKDESVEIRSGASVREIKLRDN